MNMSNINFIEFSIINLKKAICKFEAFGFRLKAKHKTRNIFVMEQNSLFIILNCIATKKSFIANYTSGDSICGIGVLCSNMIDNKVNNDVLIYKNLYNAMEIIPFIGNCQFYLIDERVNMFDNREWISISNKQSCVKPALFTDFDHIAFAVNQGKLDYWTNYINNKLPEFRCTSNVDVEGNYSGMKSIAFISSSNRIKIPIVEPKSSKSQVQTFLNILKAEGAHHLAFKTNNIVSSIEEIKKNNIRFLEAPHNYYQTIENQLNVTHHHKLKIFQHNILIDTINNNKILYQTFTEKQIGPIVFELVERHNYEGFGEGNYKALYISAEQSVI